MKPKLAIALLLALILGGVAQQSSAQSSWQSAQRSESEVGNQDCVQSEQQAQQAIKIFATAPEAYVDLADALVCLQQLDKAIAAY